MSPPTLAGGHDRAKRTARCNHLFFDRVSTTQHGDPPAELRDRPVLGPGAQLGGSAGQDLFRISTTPEGGPHFSSSPLRLWRVVYVFDLKRRASRCSEAEPVATVRPQGAPQYFLSWELYDAVSSKE